MQVTYLISDPERPPPNSYLVQQAKEDAFTSEYFNRTGTYCISSMPSHVHIERFEPNQTGDEYIFM